MANLSAEDRRAAWRDLMADLSREREPLALTKPDLRAAVDAVDAWVNSNAASLNNAIPQPARSALTSAQKARLLTLVVRKRYIKGA